MSATISIVQDIYQGQKTGTAVAWPAGMTNCTATGLISNQDAANTATVLTSFGVDASFDDQKTWNPAAFGPYQGGQADPKNPGQFIMPAIEVGYEQSPPTHVRASIDSPNSLSIGSSLSFS